MSAELGRMLSKADGVERADLDDETVLFHGGHLHRLNATGSVVWSSIRPGSTMGEVVRQVAARFVLPRDQLLDTVVQFCAELSRHGLLRDDEKPRTRPDRRPVADGPFVGPGDLPPPLEGTSSRITHRSGRFVALGYDFAIESTSLVVGEFLSDIFGGLSADGTADHLYLVDELSDGRWAIMLDGTGIHTAASAETAIRHVVWHVNSEAIRRSDDRLIVHGAGAIGAGRTVILPGEMNAGKTTLVAGLLLAGYEYLSDELLAFDARGHVHPYPRPMNIGRGSWEPLAALKPQRTSPLTDQWFVNPLGIRGSVLGAPSAPEVLIAPRYRAGARDELTAMSKADALQLLHNQTMAPRPLDAEAFFALVATVRGVRCYRLSMSTLPGAVSMVGNALRNDVKDGETH